MGKIFDRLLDQQIDGSRPRHQRRPELYRYVNKVFPTRSLNELCNLPKHWHVLRSAIFTGEKRLYLDSMKEKDAVS